MNSRRVEDDYEVLSRICGEVDWWVDVEEELGGWAFGSRQARLVSPSTTRSGGLGERLRGLDQLDWSRRARPACAVSTSSTGRDGLDPPTPAGRARSAKAGSISDPTTLATAALSPRSRAALLARHLARRGP